MDALNYETFIRRAFGYKINGQRIPRGGDPAALANTDIFTDDSIVKVKIAVGYAMQIFRLEIFNAEVIDDDSEYDRIENFCDRVITANNINEISKLIEEFETTVLDKYFNINNGVTTLK